MLVINKAIVGASVCAFMSFPGQNPRPIQSLNENEMNGSIVFNGDYLYSDVSIKISNVSKKLIENLNKLNEFKNFTSNWNGYDADPFSNKLISSVTEIIKKLKVQPQVFPVADDSIQLEYDGKNGRYLEIQIYENEAHYYFDDGNGNDLEDTIEPHADAINKIVEDFYGQSL